MWAGKCFAVANTKSRAIRYHLPCLVSQQKMIILVLYLQIQLSSRQVFNQYFENEGPIDDEPLNEYVYNMHLFMVTLLCN